MSKRTEAIHLQMLIFCKIKPPFNYIFGNKQKSKIKKRSTEFTIVVDHRSCPGDLKR